MTIYEIKRLTQKTAPYFFSRDTMKLFGQTLKDFRITRQPDGKYLIVADSGDNWNGQHTTKRLFDPKTNELEMVKD